jgi:uncharacterized protein (TIGR02284 family)
MDFQHTDQCFEAASVTPTIAADACDRQERFLLSSFQKLERCPAVPSGPCDVPIKGLAMTKITSVLNELIEISNDGDKGFRQAAEDAKNPELKALLLRRASDCASGAAQLRQQVSALGGKPEEGGTAGGAVHRGWVSLKAAVAGRTDLAILEECERGEDVAKARYQDALKQDLPAEILALVQTQYEGVVRNHDQIRDLRDRMRATS